MSVRDTYFVQVGDERGEVQVDRQAEADALNKQIATALSVRFLNSARGFEEPPPVPTKAEVGEAAAAAERAIAAWGLS